MPVVGSHAAAGACARGQRRAVRLGQLARQRLARLVSRRAARPAAARPPPRARPGRTPAPAAPQTARQERLIMVSQKP